MYVFILLVNTRQDPIIAAQASCFHEKWRHTHCGVRAAHSLGIISCNLRPAKLCTDPCQAVLMRPDNEKFILMAVRHLGFSVRLGSKLNKHGCSHRYVVFSFPPYLHKSVSAGVLYGYVWFMEDIKLGLCWISARTNEAKWRAHLHLCAARYLHRDRDSIKEKKKGGGALITLWNLKTINFVCQVMFLSS